MKMSFLKSLCLGALLCVFWGCQSHQNEKEPQIDINEELEVESGIISFNPEEYKAEDIVFYNLFSPVELTYLVDKKEAYYNSSLINPLNNITKYNSSAKVALNLGVYGADISYLWMFQQSQQSLSYRAAIQRLSDKLEIPRDFVNFNAVQAESNAQIYDSLVHIARVSYKKSDAYLNGSGKQHTAGLILLGGWIETLFIATQMYEKPDSKLMGKIALQKYSLNSLISLLQNSQDDLNVAEYLLLLKKLKRAFDDLQINFSPESLMIDTVSKHIQLNKQANLQIIPEDLAEIRLITRQIRTHMIQ